MNSSVYVSVYMYVCMCADICVCVYVFIQDPEPDPGSDPELSEKSDPDPGSDPKKSFRIHNTDIYGYTIYMEGNLIRWDPVQKYHI
jgi:hypothetical protein